MIAAISRRMFWPSARMSPPSRIATASPMAGWPLTRNSGCGGSATPRRTSAMSPSRISRPSATKLTASMSSAVSKAPETRTEQALVPGLHHAGRQHQVLRLQRLDQRRVVQPEPGQPLGREFDEDYLVLRAQDLDLRDVGHLQQAGAHLLDLVAQLAVA